MSDVASKKMAVELIKKALANNYVLYVKARAYRYNGEGFLFHALDDMLGDFSKNIASAIDALCDILGFLNEYVPGTLAEISKLSEIKGDYSSGTDKEILDDLTNSIAVVMESFELVISAAHDEKVAILITIVTEHMKAHAKFASKFGSILNGL